MLFPAIVLRVLVQLAAFGFVSGAGLPLQPVLVTTIPETPSLENLAVQRNGRLLVTSTHSSSLFLVSPNENWTSSVVIHQFANLTALLGITELEQDVFYVTGAVTLTASNPYNEIWKVDMRSMRVTSNGEVVEPATVSLVVAANSGILFNGMTRLALDDMRHILVADSINGTVTRIDVTSGEAIIVIDDPKLSNSNETNLAVAVNGIHTHGDKLFFTNLNQGILGRVPISTSTGQQTGSIDVLATDLFVADDFTLSADAKKAWVTMNGAYNLIEVDVLARTSRVLINSKLLGAESSVAFGRDCADKAALYITTAQPSGNSTVGGVVRLQLN